jgi:uncharacterized membrane protein
MSRILGALCALFALSLAGCATNQPVDAFGDTPKYRVIDMGPRSVFLKEWRYNPFKGTPFEEMWEKKHPKPPFTPPDSFEKGLIQIFTKHYGSPLPDPVGSAKDIDESGRIAGSTIVLTGEAGMGAEAMDIPAMFVMGETYTLKAPSGGVAYGMNDQLQLVGGLQDGPLSWRPFVWHGKTSTFEELPAGDANLRIATAINDSGTIVGYASTSIGHAAFVRKDGAYEWLPSGSLFTYPEDVNASGVVVGHEVSGFVNKARRWVNGQPKPLKGVVNDNGNAINSRAYAVNDVGIVVGSLRSGGKQRPAFWGVFANPDPTILGPSNIVSGEALDVNLGGQTVGTITASNGPYAFHYPGFKDLNDHIPQGTDWILEEAVAVNDKGWIAGNGSLGGDPRVFLLVPWDQSPYVVEIGNPIEPIAFP